MATIVDVQKLIAPYADTLEGMGWTIDSDESSVGTFRRFKNGKLRKTSDVWMCYSEFRPDYCDVDDDGNLVYFDKPAERPWYVSSRRTERASTFATWDRAMERFVELCEMEAEKLGLKDSG